MSNKSKDIVDVLLDEFKYAEEGRYRYLPCSVFKDAADEIVRLRAMLKECMPYIAGWAEAKKLFSEIQNEVSDE